MAAPTNTFTRYDAVGVREDLSDIIYDISPVEVPLLTNIGKKKAKQTFFEWQTDALAAAVTTNAVIEGDDTAAIAVSPTTRVGNYTQISKKAFTISGTLEATDRAGRAEEAAYQKAKRLKELKRDMEATLTSSQVAVAGDNSTARKTAALDPWLKTNRNNGNGGTGDYAYTATPITARTAATTANIRTFSETILKDIIKQQWSSGGQTKMLMVGPFNKSVVSGFAGIAAQRHNVSGAQQGTIIGAADVYVSDFGNVSVVPNRFMPEDRAYLIDPEYLSLATLRPVFSEKLAKTGDSEKFHLLTEYGLQVDNEKAHAVARDLAAA
ncbi:DUF5309 domain-containing protein [Brevundimonas pondensis]|uniref:DUF5309 domain-containing protein n=1 Tax=Brevundimonas pondensis TaxID=2774189 RepID=A0ABX7SK81_9CAUL|nr:DUF5309 domain-containing protein [Brevundimonas pondensis]QTC88104.1 DUF5309 domain-containing protein [Brevundimonas pondensis]